jgi:plasmid maintenance system antidote protein VapI
MTRLPTIRAALEHKREWMCWSHKDMARRLGLEPSEYSEFVKGRRKLPHNALCLAYGMGVSADVLLQTRRSKLAYEDRQRRLLAEQQRLERRAQRARATFP